jgi:hypothetical protein
MRLTAALALTLWSAGVAAADFKTLLAGQFTSEEAVYFAKESGKTPPPWIGMSLVAEGEGLRLKTVDAFGKPGLEDQLMAVDGLTTTTGKCSRTYAPDGEGFRQASVSGTCKAPGYIDRVSPAGLTIRLADGSDVALQRGRPFGCWVSSPKGKKPDGSDEWSFERLKLHDAGGRALASAGAKPFVIRMRNVTWPSGPNRPSLVLYVHTPDEPDRAIIYSWADPGAKRVGVNLRSVQASCTLEGSGA